MPLEVCELVWNDIEKKLFLTKDDTKKVSLDKRILEASQKLSNKVTENNRNQMELEM